MTESITAAPKSEIVARWQRARAHLKTVRKEAEEISGRAVNAAAGLAGGALSGALRGWEDEPMMIPGTEIPADVGIAALAIVAGVTGLAGKSSDALCSLGTGVGAAALAFHVRDAVRESRAD